MGLSILSTLALKGVFDRFRAQLERSARLRAGMAEGGIEPAP